jgi:uncharacterized membrane protein
VTGARGPAWRLCVLASAACVVILGIRSAFPGEDYAFLVWNLFLAWVPLFLAAAFARTSGRRLGVLLVAAWLLFLPNAPYIVSDFVHLEDSPGAWVLLDAVLIAAFAATGLLLGFESLRLVQTVTRQRLGEAAAWALAGVSVVLCGVGIYLGRVHELNSWDAITRPGRLLGKILPALANPLAHLTTFGLTLALGLLLLLAYVSAYRAAERRARRDR